MTVRLGTSFSSRRSSSFRLPVESTFRSVLELGFGVIRLSAYWDEIRKDGYGELDRLLDATRTARQPILLTVGMKAMQWPEFYLPAGVQADPDRVGRVGREPGLAEAVLAFVSETVARYRDRPEIIGWQVENEPFNRSGPRGWWIDPGLVRRELDAVRGLDGRPVVLNAFGHFDSTFDSGSRPRLGPFGLRRLVPEEEILDILGPRDILGLDVYTSIGAEDGGGRFVRRAASDWAGAAGRRLRQAEGRGRTAWIIESQAEPWEPSRDTYGDPISFTPAEMESVHGGLVREGFSTILLWGCEYWLWRAAAGDHRWLDAARRLLGETPA